jgi:hypothetical protein
MTEIQQQFFGRYCTRRERYKITDGKILTTRHKTKERQGSFDILRLARFAAVRKQVLVVLLFTEARGRVALGREVDASDARIRGEGFMRPII